MPKLLFLLFFFIEPILCFSQGSDLISVRRKNGAVIKTFFTGSPIVFETKGGSFIEGTIKEIKNDSLLVTVYQTKVFLTNLGVTHFDTVSIQLVRVNYKEIESIKVFKRHRFVRGKIDKLLMYGGAGFLGLNVINHGINGESLKENNNLRELGIAATAFSVGLIIKKLFYVNRFSRKKHKIIYLKLLDN